MPRWWVLLLFFVTVAGAIAAGAWVGYSERSAEVARRQAAAAATAAAVPTVVDVPTAVPYRGEGPDMSLPAAYDAPVEISQGPRIKTLANLHLGPNPNYAVIGTLQGGALVDVVGRDETSQWISIVFPPNSTFHAWLPATSLLDVQVDALPVETVRWLPRLSQ